MLKGKVALITGGSRGIGAAIARKYAEAGATVIINCSHSTEKAEALKEELEAKGQVAEVKAWDVSSFSETEAAIKELVDCHGKIDIVVNNAGITRDGLLMKMSEADFDDVIGINLKGAFNVTRHVSRYMLKARGGKIINMASVSGILGNAGQANYSASKAGIIGLTKSSARELASRNITVNAIAPGFVKTEMTAVLSEEVQKKILETIPLGKVASVEDIANVAYFLASEAADYMTGQVLSVDGGMAM